MSIWAAGTAGAIKFSSDMATTTKSTVECYKIRGLAHGAWADITVDADANTGRIQIASDYGSWENYWGACGCPFKEFLIGLDMHYAAGKFGAGRWFDHEATINAIKADIDEYARDDEERNGMMEEWAALEDCTEVNSFCMIAFQSDYLRKLWDTGPDIKKTIDPSFRKFWENAWPVFIEELKKEI